VIAGRVQQSSKNVSPESVGLHGAADLEIHDTVFIAAAFSMYNRYVDGLATWQPRDPAWENASRCMDPDTISERPCRRGNKMSNLFP
jgi:hypothetical protein